MPDDFRFDVFLSHSSKDKPVVRALNKKRHFLPLRLEDAPIKFSNSRT